MTNWTPSEGLKRADAVVGEIEQAVDADVAPSVLRHRLTEIVAKAIDAAIWNGKPADAVYTTGFYSLEKPEDCPPTAAYTNGHHPVIVSPITPGIPDGAVVSIDGGPFAGTHMVSTVSEAPAKKKPGRPKGSTKKKPKAPKEAPAVME